MVNIFNLNNNNIPVLKLINLVIQHRRRAPAKVASAVQLSYRQTFIILKISTCEIQYKTMTMNIVTILTTLKNNISTDQHSTTPFKNASTKSVGNGGWRPCLEIFTGRLEEPARSDKCTACNPCWPIPRNRRPSKRRRNIGRASLCSPTLTPIARLV